jgi:hypothetical protein
MHALERAIEMKGSGKYSHRCQVAGVAKAYLKLQKVKLKRGVYEDVAYIEGYINGLTYLLMTEDERSSVRVPMYFMFGSKDEISDVSGLIKRLSASPAPHKAAHKRALVYLNRLADPASAEFHHPPWL